MPLTLKQIAFDTAVKSRNNFDYVGICDIEALRQQKPELNTMWDRLVEIRDTFNEGLAVEGQNINGDAPHKPFYFDYIFSLRSNALAFRDEDHSFIGVTLALMFDVADVARLLVASSAVVTVVGLSVESDREPLRGLLFWMLLGFIVSHEYTHHTHGHLDGAFDVDEIVTGAMTGNLKRQAREADADGWAAYLLLAHWVTAGGLPSAAQRLGVADKPAGIQEDITFACFLVAQAGYTFLRQPEPLTKDTVYWKTHPPQSVRLQLMSRYALKFSKEIRPALREAMTQERYQTLIDAVSTIMWKVGNYEDLWRAQVEFIRSTDGAVYVEALLAELDNFRATLREWEEGSSETVA